MEDRSEGSLIEMDHARRQKQKVINNPLQRQVTIDILPEDVLLGMFDYYMAEANDSSLEPRRIPPLEYKGCIWEILVHVCQKWRNVVFRSPLRLNLQILCSARTPVMQKLAVWPLFPIIKMHFSRSISKCGEDNIIAALGHSDLVCAIGLIIPSLVLESVFAATQKTFVSLEDLWLRPEAMDDRAPVVSDSFLGGSAPHLRNLTLVHIPFPFPVLRKLPLTAPNLVGLQLINIPHSGYISPERMVTCLSALSRLKYIYVRFKSPRSRPPREGRHPRPPPTRSVLPALTMLTFIGVSEYLEDLVTRIDAPLLNELIVIFFHQLILDTPQLVQFISRTSKLKAYDEARVYFSLSSASIRLLGRDSRLALGSKCKQLDWQLSSLVQALTSSFPQALILTVERLCILEYKWSQPRRQHDIENDQWFELFHPFTTVKNLYLSQDFIPRMVPTLQELIGERVTEVLPNLERIFMSDHKGLKFIPEAMQRFVAARQPSSRPIAISFWNGWSTVDDVDD